MAALAHRSPRCVRAPSTAAAGASRAGPRAHKSPSNCHAHCCAPRPRAEAAGACRRLRLRTVCLPTMTCHCRASHPAALARGRVGHCASAVRGGLAARCEVRPAAGQGARAARSWAGSGEALQHFSVLPGLRPAARAVCPSGPRARRAGAGPRLSSPAAAWDSSRAPVPSASPVLGATCGARGRGAELLPLPGGRRAAAGRPHSAPRLVRAGVSRRRPGRAVAAGSIVRPAARRCSGLRPSCGWRLPWRSAPLEELGPVRLPTRSAGPRKLRNRGPLQGAVAAGGGLLGGASPRRAAAPAGPRVS